MKKLILVVAIPFFAVLAACNGAHNKTGGESRDSAASYGNSGPVDTSNSAHSSSAGAASSDTTHTGGATANPTVDSAKRK